MCNKVKGKGLCSNTNGFCCGFGESGKAGERSGAALGDGALFGCALSGGCSFSGTHSGFTACFAAERQNDHSAHGKLNGIEQHAAPGGEAANGQQHDDAGDHAHAEQSESVVALGTIPQLEEYGGDNNRDCNDNTHNIYPAVQVLPETSLLLSE